MTPHRKLVAVLAILGLSACQTPPIPALLFDGMGSHKRKVSTSVPKAQIYFDQGLALSYGFNHDEAANSFAKVARLDPECAMA